MGEVSGLNWMTFKASNHAKFLSISRDVLFYVLLLNDGGGGMVYQEFEEIQEYKIHI